VSRCALTIVLTDMDVGNAGVVRNDRRPTLPVFLPNLDVENAGIVGAFICHYPRRLE
jgi:hypothetical protein